MVSIDSFIEDTPAISASTSFKETAVAQSSALYEQADNDRLAFWDERAKDLTWFSPWKTTLDWQRPYAKWFVGGTLNACYNCLDVHLSTKRKDKKALIWEGELGQVKTYTYADLHEEVSRFSAVLQDTFHVQKGDRVTFYMPLIPELVIGVLACARIGAIHSVVFGGFSAASLKDRIQDSDSKLLITADGGYRRGSIIPLKAIADEALEGHDTPIENVLLISHVGKAAKITLTEGQDHWYHLLRDEARTEVSAVPMASEDILFILYTSGTTGKPKGIIHTTGGYLTHAKYSTKQVFDLKEEDIYWCTADVGWITGHTYLIYGPLANGATVFMYEGTPDYPDKDQFWKLAEKHSVSILYTAPTAIRAFMKWGTSYPDAYDLSALRLLGTVGEPINPEAWRWYYDHIGQKKCPVVDTWWQTETGGIMISNIPAINDMKPGFAGPTLPGISAEILDSEGATIEQGGGYLSLTEPWPSMLRGIWGDPERYEEVYWRKYDAYFAGDGAKRDSDGYFMVLGRIDDVLNVSGHRIGTMEVESALVDYSSVAEAAVAGIPDDIKGQAIVAFVILKQDETPSPELEKQLIAHVAKQIGAIAKPKRIIFTPELPKTRSGKIMRRILKALASGEPVGDCTTLANPQIVEELNTQLTAVVV